MYMDCITCTHTHTTYGKATRYSRRIQSFHVFYRTKHSDLLIDTVVCLEALKTLMGSGGEGGGGEKKREEEERGREGEREGREGGGRGREGGEGGRGIERG